MLSCYRAERMSYKYFMKNPCNTLARIPNPRFTLSSMKKAVSMAFDHLLPAYLMDAYLRIVGRRPMSVDLDSLPLVKLATSLSD